MRKTRPLMLPDRHLTAMTSGANSPSAATTCVILTNGNVFARIIVEPVFTDPRFRVTGVVIVTGDYNGRSGVASAWALARETTIPYLIYKVLLLMIYRVGRGFGANAARNVQSVARVHDVPLLKVRSVSDERVGRFIKERGPDVLLSVSCPQHIPAQLRQLAARACVNVHSSLLPAYAGLAPYFWVLANGERESGTTVHYMVEQLDAGDVLAQRRLPIEFHTSAFALFHGLAREGALALLDGLAVAALGASARAQGLAARTYYSHPDLQSYIRLRQRGYHLIRISELRQALFGEQSRATKAQLGRPQA